MTGKNTLATQDWYHRLQQHPVLHVIPERLQQAAQLIRFTANTLLFTQGEPPTGLMFVLSGHVELIRYSEQGAPIILQRVQHGFVAEASLYAPSYHCHIQATTAGELLLFSRREFLAALAQEPDFASGWINLLSQQLRQARTQNARLGLPYAADRVRHYVVTEGTDGQVVLNGSRKAWAQELGLTHEALYRCLKQMRQAGLIAIEGRVIRILPSM